MNLSDTAVICDGVMAREVGGELVILDLRSSTYFGLDAVGARIWQLLAQGLALNEIAERMSQEFEISSADVQRDILALVESLAANGLIALASS
ncbi:MAG: PqqD family protein [Pseudomonadota bacterium]